MSEMSICSVSGSLPPLDLILHTGKVSSPSNPSPSFSQVWQSGILSSSSPLLSEFSWLWQEAMGGRERERAVLLLLMQSALLTFFPWSREKGERERFHLVPLFLSLSLFLFFSGLREELEKGGGRPNFRSASGGGRAGKKFSSPPSAVPTPIPRDPGNKKAGGRRRAADEARLMTRKRSSSPSPSSFLWRHRI